MPVTIKVNGMLNALAHKGSNHIANSTAPDVCKTPSPAGPVPIPYPIIVSMSSDLVKGTTTVKADGGNSCCVKDCELSRCTGDEPGTAGGVVSNVNMKEAKFILFSFDVKLDGKNACRFSDKLTMNHMNTICMAGLVGPTVTTSFADIVENPSLLCGKLAEEVAKILGPGWKKENYGKTGTGWKFVNETSGEIVFYHTGGRHVGPYWGFSSGTTGKVKVVGKDYKPLPGDKAKVSNCPE